MIENMYITIKYTVVRISKEIGIFKIAQHKQIDKDATAYQQFSSKFICCSVYFFSDVIIDNSRKE